MPKPPAQHGTRSRYTAGCHCDACKLAEAEYQKARRHGVSKVTPITSATEIPTTPKEREVGAVETGVLGELDGIAMADARPGMKATAIALARVLDNPLTVAQHPSAAHRLTEILTTLRKGAEKKSSRLAAVREMSRPKEAAG